MYARAYRYLLHPSFVRIRRRVVSPCVRYSQKHSNWCWWFIHEKFPPPVVDIMLLEKQRKSTFSLLNAPYFLQDERYRQHCNPVLCTHPTLPLRSWTKKIRVAAAIAPARPEVCLPQYFYQKMLKLPRLEHIHIYIYVCYTHVMYECIFTANQRWTRYN